MKSLSRIRSKAKITPSSCLSWILFNVSVTALFFIVCSSIAYAGQVTLGWDKSTESDVAGYKVYYGTASRNYTQSIKISSPNTTTCTILNLTDGQKYYFAAIAYNTELIESDYSSEVFTTVNPVTTSVPTATTSVRLTTSSSTTLLKPTTTTTVRQTTSSSTTSLRPATTTTVRPTTSISTTSLKPATTTTIKTTTTTSIPRSTTSTTITGCTYSISPTSHTFRTTGGTGTVKVSTLNGCGWTAAVNNNAGWIKIISGSSGTGNGTVSYSVAANTSRLPRIGTITIAGKTFTVMQKRRY